MGRGREDRHTVVADWRNGRSAGYLRTSKGQVYFDAPMISHIKDDLYVGGCEPGYDLEQDFKAVVSLFPWGQYKIGPGVARTEIRMYDGPNGVDWDDLGQAVKAVKKGLDRGKTLVHCQAGINRSNLVTAAYLMTHEGYSADDAIALLRDSRSEHVLANQHFVAQLHALEDAEELPWRP